ncbi:MAG: FAD-binding oxidoreductase [Gemmatimonadetes bacterium]|nr:FAD-binding oxidoreductase [Gemmatimonadota bacterium]
MLRRAFVRSSLLAAVAPSLPVRPSSATAPKVHRIAAGVQDLTAVTGDGRTVTIPGRAIADLRSSLRGGVLLAGDDGYDQARRILNPSFDKRPALVAQPTGPADIRAAVNFARDHGGLLLAVKCGGHSHSGQSTCDRGMIIDLSRFRDVWVDEARRRIRLTGGTLLGQVDHEALALGLATTMGTVSHTGAGGLITGGGFGRLARRFGMSIDNLLSVDVVTADGMLRRASESDNPDLFWGIRGGGGNFGIVTSFEMQLHPMTRRIVGGGMVFPYSKARDILRLFEEIGRGGPDELDFGFALVHPPGGAQPIAAVAICYSGPEAQAERVLAPVRKLGTPLSDRVRAMDYVALQRSGDVDDPRARGSYLKSGFINAMPDRLIDTVLATLEGHPGRNTQVFAQLSGGAIARVAPGATAFSQRDVLCNLLASIDWKQGDDPSAHVAWLRRFWEGVEPHTQGFYVNDIELDATAAAVRANYRANHDRLVALKNKYDPGNLFRLNANVKPSV